MSEIQMPIYHELLWPTLRAVRDLGGSGTIKEIVDRVLEQENFSEEHQAVLHAGGPQTEIEYRLAWARTNLKGIGALTNSSRGVWSVTELGRALDATTVLELDRQWRAQLAERRRQNQTGEDDGDTVPEPDELTWKDQLLARLLEMGPDAFERLAQRLLPEAGFINVNVLGRSGDGGLDGVGMYRPTLVSFPVFFQCKRYKGSVGSSAVRDFRGAMSGRGEKGLLITTGTFSRDATAEALRDGAPAVELIDGDNLCDLLKEYRLGVNVRERIEEDIELDPDFFVEV